MHKLSTLFSNVVTIKLCIYVSAVCPLYCDTTIDRYMQAYELVRSVSNCENFLGPPCPPLTHTHTHTPTCKYTYCFIFRLCDFFLPPPSLFLTELRIVDVESHSISPNYFSLTHTEKTGELPTSLPVGCTWATEWAARGLPMRILPCKLGFPLLPYMETVDSSVGSSVGSPLLPYMETVSSSVGSGVGCPWAAHGNFAMQIRLPTTSIYGYSGQLSVQLSGQPT